MVENTRILFVDDEERNCKLFKRYFARNKAVDVITALSAEDAKVVLERLEPIHILVTDQRMPISKGHALLCHCHKSYPHIYRVLTTANSEEAEQLMTQGSMRDIIQLFIHKPWDSSEIRSLATLFAINNLIKVYLDGELAGHSMTFLFFREPVNNKI